MATIYLLDGGPFALLAHDRAVRRAAIQTWLLREMSAGVTVFMSEFADYEVPRELDAASDKPLTDVPGSDTSNADVLTCELGRPSSVGSAQQAETRNAVAV